MFLLVFRNMIFISNFKRTNVVLVFLSSHEMTVEAVMWAIRLLVTFTSRKDKGCIELVLSTSIGVIRVCSG